MEFALSLAAMFIAIVAMLAINYFIFKREKTLLEINESYRDLNYHLFDELFETRKVVKSLSNELDEYRSKIFDFIAYFNATYSNTKLDFDEDKKMIIVEDIDTDDETPTEEEITQQNEEENENQ